MALTDAFGASLVLYPCLRCCRVEICIGAKFVRSCEGRWWASFKFVSGLADYTPEAEAQPNFELDSTSSRTLHLHMTTNITSVKFIIRLQDHRCAHVTQRCWAKSSKRHLTSSSPSLASRRRVIDESTLAGAQHKPSLSGPSLGHLITELSATRPGTEGLRVEGQTMSEEQRTQARTVAKWIVGVPLAFGSSVVAVNWLKQT